MISPAIKVGDGTFLCEGDGLREVEALVIEKEIGFPAENFFRDNRPANSRAVPAVMEAGKRCRTGLQKVIVVILPALRRPVVIFVIFVARAVPGIGSALGDNLHFGTGGTIEISRLAGSIYFEFFDAILRSRDHARRAAIDLLPGYSA